MHINKALAVDDHADVGSVIETEISPALHGRIVAEAHRKTIIQQTNGLKTKVVR
jgi:hypothetical protein